MSTDKKITNWISTILTGIQKMEGDSGKEILNECGKECAKMFGSFQTAQKIRNEVEDKDNYDELFYRFKYEYYKTDDVFKEGNIIHLEYPECYCPMVKEGINDPFLCNCTIGYTKAVYETLFGKEVEVKLLQSILRGDKICKQKITILE